MRTGHQPEGRSSIRRSARSSRRSWAARSPRSRTTSASPLPGLQSGSVPAGFLGPCHAALTVSASDNFGLPAGHSGEQHRIRRTGSRRPQSPGRRDEPPTRPGGSICSASLQAGSRGPPSDGRPDRSQDDLRAGDPHDAERSCPARSSWETNWRRSATATAAAASARMLDGTAAHRCRGVPFVEVSLGSSSTNALAWDTHQNNFNAVKRSRPSSTPGGPR